MVVHRINNSNDFNKSSVVEFQKTANNIIVDFDSYF